MVSYYFCEKYEKHQFKVQLNKLDSWTDRRKIQKLTLLVLVNRGVSKVQPSTLHNRLEFQRQEAKRYIHIIRIEALTINTCLSVVP